jgi:hypothetical protein
MAISFRPAVRENVPLIVAPAGGTGSGKTFTGMELASGMIEAIAPGEPFAVIDTENRRATHYADRFKFHHADLRAPFRPAAYEEAIVAADAAGYPVILVDSISHEHSGDGGLLDWHEEELDRMAGSDYSKRDACNMAAWIKPKKAHKALVSKMLGIKAHLILCMRAEPKVEMKKVEGKWKIVPKESLVGKDGWIPTCEKNLPYEATVSFLLTAEKPGVPLPIKLQAQHRSFFPEGQPITRETGRQLALWAAGAPIANAITEEQRKTLEAECKAAGIEVDRLLATARVARLEDLTTARYEKALGWVRSQAQQRRGESDSDEAAMLKRIDTANSRDDAAEILDGCRELPFYDRLSEAYRARWADAA